MKSFNELIQQIADEGLGVFACPNKNNKANIIFSFVEFDQLSYLQGQYESKELNERLLMFERAFANLIKFEEVEKLYQGKVVDDQTLSRLIDHVQLKLKVACEGDYQTPMKQLWLETIGGFEKEAAKIQQQKTVEELEQVAFRLINIKKNLIELNTDGLQVDFVTNPYLATATDKASEIMGEIEKIVYQKN